MKKSSANRIFFNRLGWVKEGVNKESFFRILATQSQEGEQSLDHFMDDLNNDAMEIEWLDIWFGRLGYVENGTKKGQHLELIDRNDEFICAIKVGEQETPFESYGDLYTALQEMAPNITWLDCKIESYIVHDLELLEKLRDAIGEGNLDSTSISQLKLLTESWKTDFQIRCSALQGVFCLTSATNPDSLLWLQNRIEEEIQQIDEAKNLFTLLLEKLPHKIAHELLFLFCQRDPRRHTFPGRKSAFRIFLHYCKRHSIQFSIFNLSRCAMLCRFQLPTYMVRKVTVSSNDAPENNTRQVSLGCFQRQKVSCENELTCSSYFWLVLGSIFLLNKIIVFLLPK